MIGFWFILAFYLVRLFKYFKSKPFVAPSLKDLFRILLPTVLSIYFSFFVYQSIQRNILWGKPIVFFEDILKYEPNSARVSNNVGNLYFKQGDLVKAEEYYRRSAEAGDIFPQPHFNIGSMLQSRGDFFGAIQEYEKAIAIDPSFHYPYQNLVAIYANQGNLVKATEYIEILKKLKPYDPRIYYNAALIYLARNDSASAYYNLEQGLRIAGSDKEAEQLIKDLLNKVK